MQSAHVKSVPDKYNCDECTEIFSNKHDCIKHMKSAHIQNNHKAGDHKCEECSYRTNIAANYLTHFFNVHTTDNFVNKINCLKPVNPAIVYMLAEQNMMKIQENKRMRKDLDYIKQALQPKSKAKKFNCQKCNTCVNLLRAYRSICWKTTAVNTLTRFLQVKLKRKVRKTTCV